MTASPDQSPENQQTVSPAVNWLQTLRTPAFLTILSLALVKLLLHLYSHGNYGIHRDEFLYLAMASRPAWGYLEVPPFVSWVAAVVHSLGGSLLAIRLFPALCGAGLLLMTGLLTHKMGGGRFAILISGIAILISLVFLRAAHLFQPVIFDQFFWLLASLLAVHAVTREDGRWFWMATGLVAGLGLLNKYTMLFWGLGMLVGLLISEHRRQLRTPWPYVAGGIALLMWLPNLLWQADNGWPFFEHMEVLAAGQFTHVSRSGFLIEQVLMHNPWTFPIWLAGIIFFLRKEGRPFRYLLWVFLTALAIMLYVGSKAYYLAPAYPMLFAAGGVRIERFIRARQKYWLRPVLVCLLLFNGILLSPYGLPYLPVKSMELYCAYAAEYLGLDGPIRTNTGELGRLPQDYADMFGWEEQVQAVAAAYDTLTPAEQEKCVLLASNYGEAGAIDHYGPRYGLPKALSFSSSYSVWGPGEKPGDVIITIGFTFEELKPHFGHIRLFRVVDHEYAVSEERNVAIYTCRRPNQTLQEAWPAFTQHRF